MKSGYEQPKPRARTVAVYAIDVDGNCAGAPDCFPGWIAQDYIVQEQHVCMHSHKCQCEEFETREGQ